jgi:hypothetical protein
MDQDETGGVEEPTLTETKAEEAEGKPEGLGMLVGTFTLDVSLRTRTPSGEVTEKELAAARDAVPTSIGLARIVDNAIYSQVPYFGDTSIRVTARRTDQ